jgi:hypothetical protein
MPYLLSFLLLILANAEAKTRSNFDVERVIPGDDSRGPFNLGVTGLIPGSDSVRVGDSLLLPNTDYTLSIADGSIVLAEPLMRGQVMSVWALRSLPVLSRMRRHSRPEEASSQIVTSAADRRQRSRRVRDDPTDESSVTVSGVKRLAVSVGTTAEPALSQSLQIEIRGTLAEGVHVSGLLSDRSLPVMASGRTQSVQDLDRVHLEVSSSTMSAGLGDVDVTFDSTEFGRYRRQLQGGRFQMHRNGTDVDLFGAVSEGRWDTRRLTTQPGYQGPYRLSNGTAPIVPGSERLHLDGRRLRRGEGQDYTVDYDRGTVTFTPTRPITGESRVTSEYQSVDPEGRIRSLGVRGQLAAGDQRLRLGTTLIRESRGGTSPGLSAGPSPGAFLSGLDGAFTPSEGLRLDGEVAWSQAVAQTQGETGHAVRVGLTWESQQAREQTSGLSALQFSGAFRRVSETFRMFDRVDEISAEGEWGWEAEGASGAGGDLSELSLRYTPVSFAAVGVELGRRTGALGGNRKGVTFDLDGGRYGEAHLSADAVRRGDGRIERAGASASSRFGWIKPTIRFVSESAEGAAVGGSRLFYAGPVSLLPDGARVREVDLTSEVGSERVSLTSNVTVAQVDQLSGSWADSVHSMTHMNRFSATTAGGFRFSGAFGQTARREAAVGPETRVVNLGRVQVGYRPGGGVFSQQIQYHVSSTGLADRDRVFREVPDGEGAHIWEDVNGNGLQEDEEFLPESGGNYDALYGVSASFDPVRESSVGLRTQLDFGRRFRDVLLLGDLALDFSVESERSSRPDSEAGIAPWTHQDFEESAGVLSASREVRSTLHLFRRRRIGSVRVDVRQADMLDRRRSEDGRTESRGLVFLGKLRPRKGWDVEGRTELATRRREGDGPFAHDIAEAAVGLRNWIRLPEGWQAAISMSWGMDRERNRDLSVDRVTLGPELRRAFRGRGRITGRFDWTRVTANETVPLFLGMADGHRRGLNYRWRIGADYRLGAYVDAFLTYDGTIRPERPTLHVGRMELRATF